MSIMLQFSISNEIDYSNSGTLKQLEVYVTVLCRIF